jgi:uncharacterized protein YggE
MSATRSALLRVAALGTVAILGIVILVPALGGSPRAAAQVITTGTSGSGTGPQGITVAGSGIVIATPDEATLSLGVQTQAATAAAAQQDAQSRRPAWRAPISPRNGSPCSRRLTTARLATAHRR